MIDTNSGGRSPRGAGPTDGSKTPNFLVPPTAIKQCSIRLMVKTAHLKYVAVVLFPDGEDGVDWDPYDDGQ